MAKIVEYEHYGFKVSVDKSLKGKHRDHCLCFRCVFFMPNTKSNCPIAQNLFEICREFGLTTPVYECPQFAKGNPDIGAMEE